MLHGLLVRIVDHVQSTTLILIACSWMSAALGAAICYRFQTDDGPRSWRGFVAFCFPKSIWLHRSSRLDALFILAGQMIPGAVFVAFVITSVGVAHAVYAALGWAFGLHPQLEEPTWLWLLRLAGALLVQDFMTFYAHYLQHKVPALWELHKVHHAAEVLVPITNRRFHPLQGLMDNGFNAVGVGAYIGLSSYALDLPLRDSSLFGVDAYFLLNLLSFYHLRHSHIRMRYGWLERHVISPMQHQLHHSRELRHWDRNFGLCFSWWDRCFGTLLLSKADEQYAQGLPQDVQPDYLSVPNLYWVPLRNLGRLAWRRRPRLPGWLHAARPGHPAPS